MEQDQSCLLIVDISEKLWTKKIDLDYELIRKIYFCLKTFEHSLIESLISDVRLKVRCLYEKGSLTEKLNN